RDFHVTGVQTCALPIFFEPQTPLSKFTIRDYKDFEGYQFKPEKQLITRINGELTIFHTIQIIKRYKPEVYIIENPAFSKIWEYRSEERRVGKEWRNQRT